MATAMVADEAGARELEGRVALVTGGSRGIGREIALLLAARGARVAFCFRTRREEAEATLSLMGAGRGLAVQADVGNADDVKRLFATTLEHFQRLDILVNNAGYGPPLAKIMDVSDEDLDKTINVNIRGAFLCLREAGKCMADGGRIINISSSLVAYTFSGSGTAIYAGSKAALEAFTKCMAMELKGRRITVNAVAPGPVETELFFTGKTEAYIEKLKEMNPLQRLGKPSDIAPLVGFLCSKEGEWVNAQVIRANGGYIS